MKSRIKKIYHGKTSILCFKTIDEPSINKHISKRCNNNEGPNSNEKQNGILNQSKNSTFWKASESGINTAKLLT